MRINAAQARHILEQRMQAVASAAGLDMRQATVDGFVEALHTHDRGLMVLEGLLDRERPLLPQCQALLNSVVARSAASGLLVLDREDVPASVDELQLLCQPNALSVASLLVRINAGKPALGMNEEGEPRPLQFSKDLGIVTAPVWSADGRMHVAGNSGYVASAMVGDFEGGAPVQGEVVVNVDTRLGSPLVISPNGELFSLGWRAELITVGPKGQFSSRRPSSTPPAILEGGPVVDADGTVYVVSRDGRLFGYKADGEPAFGRSANGGEIGLQIGNGWPGEPAITSNGHIAVVSGDSPELFVFSKEGRSLFGESSEGKPRGVVLNGAVRADIAPVCDASGRIAVVDGAGKLYLVDSDGSSPLGSNNAGAVTGFSLGDVPSGAPIFAHKNKLYINGKKTGLIELKLNAASKGLERRILGNPVFGLLGSPCLGPDGVVYVTGEGRALHAYLPNGEPAWGLDAKGEARSIQMFEPLVSGPTIGPDGRVYVPSNKGKVFVVE